MKNLSGYTDDYSEYAERERKLLDHMSAVKMLQVEYATEMKKDILPNTILFYANNGYGLGGIPRCILNEVVKSPTFRKYKCIVCLRNDEMVKQMKKEGFRSRRIRYEKLGANLASNFYRWLARAQYLVIDGVLPSIYVPREEQTYIQASFLYSGLAQGYQREMRYTIRSLDYVKNFLCADYIISPSDLYTQEILKDSYYIDHVYQGRVLTCKSPVIECLNQISDVQIYKETGLKKKNPERKEVFVIGSEQHNGIDIAQILVELAQTPEYENYEFYYKPPQVGYRAAREWMHEHPVERVNLVLNQADILPWLKRCDIVLSDYNAGLFYSIYLEKPTILLDIGKRREIQCEYMKKYMSGLPMASTAQEIRKLLGRVSQADKETVKELFEASVPAEAILDILEGKETQTQSLQSDKEKICIVVSMGHFSKDALVAWEVQIGILIKQMLKAGKDITVFCDEPESEFYLNKVEQIIPKGVRVLYRIAERVMTKQEMIDSSYLIRNFSFCDDLHEALGKMDVELNRRDLRRSMGKLSFDTAIYAGPFSGKFVMLMYAMDVKMRYYWDQRNYPVTLEVSERTEKNQKRFENLCKVPELFDGVLHWDETEFEVIKENHLYKDLSKHKLLKDFLDFDVLLNRSAMDVISFRGRDYWVVSFKEYLDEQQDFQLLIKNRDREHRKALHITYAVHERFEEIIAKLQSLHEENPDDIFYIFEDQCYCYKELELLVTNMGIKDYVHICSRYFLWDELREFSTYYCVFPTDDIYEVLCRKLGVSYERL